MKKVMSFFRVSALMAGSLIMTSLLLTSCLKNNNDDSNNAPVAGLMAFNLVPDKTAINIALSGNSITQSPLPYTNFTGAYVSVYAGNRAVEAYDNTQSPFASTPANFETDKYYSAFVMGNDGNYQNVVVQDNFDSLSGSSGQAYIRYVNAIPDSSNPAVTITGGGSTVVNQQADYKAVSEFVAVAPGQVVIDVSNGINIDADRTITVEARKIYTVLLTGVPGSATAPVQIKFITNGQLDATDGQRVSAGRVASSL
jgi:hypothetical protein